MRGGYQQQGAWGSPAWPLGNVPAGLPPTSAFRAPTDQTGIGILFEMMIITNLIQIVTSAAVDLLPFQPKKFPLAKISYQPTTIKHI